MRKLNASASQTCEYLYTKELWSYHTILHLLCIQQGQKWSAVLHFPVPSGLHNSIVWKGMFSVIPL